MMDKMIMEGGPAIMQKYAKMDSSEQDFHNNAFCDIYFLSVLDEQS